MTPEVSKEKQDVVDYLEELRERLPRFARRAAAIPTDAPYSAEWFKRVGKFWSDAREQEGLSRYDVAGRMGVPVNAIRFLEVGLAEPEEIHGDLLKRYSQVLVGLAGDNKNRYRYEDFCQVFGIRFDQTPATNGTPHSE